MENEQQSFYEQFYDSDDLNKLENVTFDSEIIMKVGSVEIRGIEETIEKAKLIRNAMRTIVVESDEDVKANKHLLAKLNKSFKAIDDKRIKLKKEFTAPYKKIDEQCKELKAIVSEADGYVRNQIKVIEEKRREEKKMEIFEIFTHKLQEADLHHIFVFDEFIKQEYLNKTYSLSKIKDDIDNWINNQKGVLDALKAIAQDEDELARAIIIYKQTFDLAITLKKLEQEKEDIQVYAEALDEKFSDTNKVQEEVNESEDSKESKWISFFVKDKDALDVEQMLQELGIEYFWN